MKLIRVQKKIERSAEELARLRAIRERFQSCPSLEELLADGEFEGQDFSEAFFAWRQAMWALKAAREEQGLTLEEVAKRSGIETATLGQLESGHLANPPLFTILKYFEALGKRLVWKFEDVPVPQVNNDRPSTKSRRQRKSKTGS